MTRKNWRFLAHVLNIAAAAANVGSCPAGRRGSRCLTHAAIAIGIEVLRAIDDESVAA